MAMEYASLENFANVESIQPNFRRLIVTQKDALLTITVKKLNRFDAVFLHLDNFFSYVPLSHLTWKIYDLMNFA